MLLTPLYIEAQNLNQWITDFINLYRSNIYWDINRYRFAEETRMRHIFPWLFVNFIIAGCAIPFCMTFLLRSLRSQASKHTAALQWLSASDQIILGTGLVLANLVCLRWSAEMVSSLNTMISLEARLYRKYSGHGVYFIKPKSISLKAVIKNYGKTLGEIRLPDGELDMAGILAHLTVISVVIIAPLIPWTLMWLNLDFMILPFKQIVFGLTFCEKVTFHVCRILIVMLAFAEVSYCCRTFPVNVIVIFRGLQKCQVLLLRQPIGEAVLAELRQLCILFAVIRDWLAFLLFNGLAMMYLCLVICTTVILVNTLAVPWHLYIFFVIGWLLAVSWTVTVLSLVVSVYSDSSKLKKAWMHSYSTQVNLVKNKLLYKTMKSFKPIGIPLGSLGTLTRETRTYYFHTGIVNTINTIIALK